LGLVRGEEGERQFFRVGKKEKEEGRVGWEGTKAKGIKLE